jgi:bifunctional NMN adenylyltransferase/nudix hydrolase
MKEKTADVGIIIGRFQVPDLHEAHKSLIQSVCDKHDKVIIFLGLSPVFNSNNPLDFEARKQMIAESFPNVVIAYIMDQPSDIVWSTKLDEQIKILTGPKQSVILYGSRDSFISSYSGKYLTQELIQDRWVSGTEIRAMLKNQVRGSRDFRHGVIWASWQRFDTVYTTVDIAVFRNNEDLLLARKPNESLWRFPGGFVDKRDNSNEQAAMRELMEECPGIEVEVITPKHYIGSFNIDDWRYRGANDSLRTLFYKTNYIFGTPKAADDIAEVQWFKLIKITDEMIVPNHIVLFKALKCK